jgi:nucleoid DNA-binding protein
MTKSEMIDIIAETSVEAMDIGELMAYAQEMMVKELAKQSKAEIQDQYEYMAG